MRFFFCLAILSQSLLAQAAIPQTIAESVGETLRLAQGQFLSVAEAMPEAKFSFVPTAGNFADARSFAEQVKHVGCTQFAFFNEIEGKHRPRRVSAEGRQGPRPRPN